MAGRQIQTAGNFDSRFSSELRGRMSLQLLARVNHGLKAVHYSKLRSAASQMIRERQRKNGGKKRGAGSYGMEPDRLSVKDLFVIAG